MVSKKLQKRKHIRYACIVSNVYISKLNEYIRQCIQYVRFRDFLKPPTQLQTTRSPRLLNGFRCFLMQNEEETLLVLFLFSTVHFCWVENDENFECSKKTVFVFKFLVNTKCYGVRGKNATPANMGPLISKYAILTYEMASFLISYLSCWWSPIFSPNGAD